jgi:hypothetical protein
MQPAGVQHAQRVDEVKSPHEVLAEHEIPVPASDGVGHLLIALDPERAHLVFGVLEHADRQAGVILRVVDDQYRELLGAHHQTPCSPRSARSSAA